METNGNLIRREDLVLHPIPTVPEQCAESVINFMNGYTKIFFGLSVLPGPQPRFVEHASMQFSNKRLIEWINVSKSPWTQHPSSCGRDVLLFVLVHSLFRIQRGDQLFGFVWIERRVPCVHRFLSFSAFKDALGLFLNSLVDAARPLAL